MKLPRIEVLWEDHNSNYMDEWCEATPKNELKPTLVMTRGFLVSENNKMIEIARDLDMDKEEASIGAHIRILKSCIVKRSKD